TWSSFFLTIRRPPCSPLFPYTTLFRSLPNCAGFSPAITEPITESKPAPGECRRTPAPESGLVISAPTSRCGRRFRPSGRNSPSRSEEHTSELQSRGHLVCRLLLEKKK